MKVLPSAIIGLIGEYVAQKYLISRNFKIRTFGAPPDTKIYSDIEWNVDLLDKYTLKNMEVKHMHQHSIQYYTIGKN